VDAQARSVTLADGTRLPYDRLVLAPGIDIRWGALPGYDEAAVRGDAACVAGGRADRFAPPSARGHGRRRARRDLGAGQSVPLPARALRARQPDRALLKTKKPKSKLIVLDAKDAFSKQRLFQAAWAELYPGVLEWVPLSKGAP